MVLVLLVSTPVLSQSFSTFSPYSRFGIGEIRNRGYANTKALGGISQGVRNSTSINFLNPATYTAQDTMSFIFDFGVEGTGVNYKTNNQANFNSGANLHHLAIQFPITKWMGASAGIQPYSHVGYRIMDYEKDPYLLSTIGPIKYYNQGRGGITQSYFGVAFEPLKGFSVGANMSYFFGTIEHTTGTIFPARTPYKNFKRMSSVVVRDIAFSFGAQYAFAFGKDKNYKVVVGGTLDNETAIGVQNILFISYPQKYEDSNFIDTLTYEEHPKSTIDFPKNVSVGLTFAYKENFMIGADYSTQDWSNAKFLNVSDSLVRSNTLRVGLQLTPNPADLRSYLKRISYRAGFYYSNTSLKLRNNQINDYGITFGVGLPFKRSNTTFNISCELGQKGTLSNSLIQETYGVVNIGFTFYDFWFIKRKFN